MASRQIIIKHYQRILGAWPVDALRPEVALQKVFRSRISNDLQASPSSASRNVSGNDAQAIASPPEPFNERKELDQVNALYSFLENRFMKKYPLSDRMLKPASKPTHYEDLIKELEEAPTRTWLQAKINKWKYAFRLR